MSAYEYVETAIWSDPTFAGLGAHSKLVYLWSFTNPRCNLIGIYKVTPRQVVAETGVRQKRVEEALRELAEVQLLHFDGTYVFVRARVKYLHTKSSKVAKAIQREVGKLDKEHPYTQAFLFLYQASDWLVEHLSGFDTPSSNPLVYPLRVVA